MRLRTILLCIFVCTCLVVAGFQFKIRREQTLLDPYVTALEPLRRGLPSGTTISLYADTMLVEHLIRARFALAPLRLISARERETDTCLVVLNAVNRDTAWQHFLAARTELWYYRGAANKYYLVRR